MTRVNLTALEDQNEFGIESVRQWRRHLSGLAVQQWEAFGELPGFRPPPSPNGHEDYLHGFVGFSDTDKLDPANPWKFQLQRFMWWDYFVKPGDTVPYTVVPVVGADKDHLVLDAAQRQPANRS